MKTLQPYSLPLALRRGRFDNTNRSNSSLLTCHGHLAALSLWLGVAALTSLSTQAQAAVVLSASSMTVTAGSTRSGFLESSAINKFGLLTTYTSGVTDWSTYFGSNPLHNKDGPYEWWGLGVNVTVKFDFGSVVDLSGIALWVEDAAGITKFNLRTETSTLLSNQVPTNNPGGANYGADLYTFTRTSTRYLYLDLLDNPVYHASIGEATGLGEVAFRQETGPAPSGVPEGASTLLLCTAGLMGMSVAARLQRRRS